MLNNRVVVVYDKEADLQYWPLIEPLAKRLSEKLATAVLVAVNHDDDMLAYVLYERGKHMDTYSSSPKFVENAANETGPIGGNPTIICEAFGSQDVDAVHAVLQKPSAGEDGGYVFALDRHRDLMQALGMTSQAFFVGYNYLDAGEFPPDLSKTDFIEVGGKP